MRVQSEKGTCRSGSSDACSRKGEHHVHNGVEVEKEKNGDKEVGGECKYEVYDSVSEKELP